MDIEKLRILGLNSYEIKALMTLLHKGKSKASFISADSGVPYGKIYDILASLEEKGLIAVIPEDVKFYVAKPVKHLKELLKEKLNELKKLEKDLDELKNLSKEHIKGEILVVKGKKGFHRLMKDIRKTENISYTIKWKADVKDINFQRVTKDLLKREVNVKTLYDYNTPKENIEYWRKNFPEFKEKPKFIDSEGIAVQITDSQVFFSIVELNSTILITSEKFAKLMKQLYEAYWDNYYKVKN